MNRVGQQVRTQQEGSKQRQLKRADWEKSIGDSYWINRPKSGFLSVLRVNDMRSAEELLRGLGSESLRIPSLAHDQETSSDAEYAHEQIQHHILCPV